MSADFYNAKAFELAEMHLSKAFTQVHCSWLEYLIPVLKKTDAHILDLGAGRDSRYMAEQRKTANIRVSAVEPAQLPKYESVLKQLI